MVTEREQYIKERDEMLLKGDVDAMLEFIAKHRLKITHLSREIAEVTLHKAITADKNLPKSYRAKSKYWLGARGHHSLDDGDIDGD